MPFIGILFSRCEHQEPTFIVGFLSFVIGPKRPNKHWQYLLVDKKATQYFMDDETIVIPEYKEMIGIRI